MNRAAVAAVALAGAVAAAMAGVTAFGVVVVAVGWLALAGLCELLGRGRARPVLPAAAVAGTLLPAVAVADPAAAWNRVPAFLAVTVLATFALVLVSGRRAGVTEGIASSLFAGLLVGVGATSLVLLRDLPAGFRWTLGLLLFCAAVAAALQVAGLLASSSAGPAGIVVAAAVVGGALLAAADPPFSLPAVAGVGAAGVAGVLGAAWLVAVLPADEPFRRRPSSPLETIAAIAVAPLLAAPVAYAVARWLTL